MFKTQFQPLLLLWLLLLGGCVETTPPPTPTTPVPTSTPTPLQTETVLPEPTPTPTSSIFHGTVLPASVYFIDSNTQQIVRLERDGTTLRLVTDEANPITAFTVDGASGWLYYVTNNQLIQLQLNNNTRTVKVDGGPITPNNAIRAPRLSPDGSTVVYLHDGLHIIRTGDSAESSQLLAADPLPPTTEQTSRIFNTLQWSPDGSRLTIQFAYYPEGQGLGLYTFADNSFVDLTQTLTSEPRCCDLSFSADSTLAYITNQQQSGITQLTLATNTTTNILTTPNEETTVTNGFHHTQDGTRYAFVGNAYPELAHPFYNLSLLDGDGVATPLAGNNYGVLVANDLLWASDDSGVLFSQYNWYSDSRANTTAQWWPFDGTPRLELPIIGRNYQWGEPAQPPHSMGDTQLDTLRTQALTDLNITLNPDNGFSDLIIRRVLLSQQTLWLVHTVGIRPFEQETPDSHRLALYSFDGTAWKMLAMSNLTSAESPDIGGPDYLSQGGVTQAFLGPDYLWLAIEGGIGAHGGLLQIVQFDGATLTVILESGNGSPLAGSIADMSGDSQHDVIVDNSDAYVFAYASGVRNPSFEVLQWNSSSLGPIYLQSYDETTPAELRTPNNRAVELANAGRWYEAQQLINTLDPLDQPTIRSNQGLINFNATARLTYANSAYPILGYLFYGDYDTATSQMASYTMPELFNPNGPLIVGTAAEGGLEMLAQLVEETTARAIGPDTTDPILAGAHFLRGWGIFLTNPTDPRVIEYVQKSAELAPENTLYTTAAAYLTTQP